MSKNTKAEVLAALKAQGVTDLSQFADYVAKLSSEKDAAGNPVIMTAIISPGYFVSH